mmetsp:Transcript_23071/g.64069  ORF Transcript_23071/g.64069 Transcript_23071/m.64069 type:complete len:266 (+) Transcript_23071:526-1323(+)
MSEWEQTSETEQMIRDSFKRLDSGFQQIERLKDSEKASVLKGLTTIMQECKRQLKDFEREARTDGMPPAILSDKKRQLVQELNTYIALKKTQTAQMQARNQLMEPSTSSSAAQQENGFEGKKTQELVQMGRKEIKEIDNSLANAQRVVQDTIEVGAKTAATLSDQTKQMETILNDLDDISFNMKKAQKVIGEITRGLVTDKCILCLLVIIALGVVVGIICTIVLPKTEGSPAPPASPPVPGLNLSPSPPPAARRMLMDFPAYAWQ